MEYPDSSTVVVKLSFPMGTILRRFNSDLYVMPGAEAEEKKFDVLTDMRGSGPWMMTSHQRSVGWEYVRNPNWYRAAERPFLDGVNFALISEPTVQLAQFRAKRLWSLTPSGEEVVSIKRDNPAVVVSPYNPAGSGANANYTITLSKLENSPLQQDVRLRHAISLLLDRDAWIDTFYNVSGLERDGLPMQSIWNSTIAGTAPEWLDPKANKLGEDSKWFHHNPDEAAKLLRAAGKFGIEQDYSYATSGFTTPQTSRQMEVMAQMLQQGGHFKLNVKTGDYTAWAQPTFFRGRGQYEGISWTSGLQSGADIDSSLWGFYAPGARNDGIYSWDRVPGLEELMKKERKELDDKKRTEIIHDIQKFLANHQPAIMFPGVATTFNLYWPWMGNAGFFRVLGNAAASPQDTLIHTWHDKAKQT
jgi:ABC-type transport system substrate-binding protein